MSVLWLVVKIVLAFYACVFVLAALTHHPEPKPERAPRVPWTPKETLLAWGIFIGWLLFCGAVAWWLRA